MHKDQDYESTVVLWKTYSFPRKSLARAIVSFFTERRFSLPHLQRKSITTNHVFGSRSTGIFGINAWLVYIFFLQIFRFNCLSVVNLLFFFIQIDIQFLLFRSLFSLADLPSLPSLFRQRYLPDLTHPISGQQTISFLFSCILPVFLSLLVPGGPYSFGSILSLQSQTCNFHEVRYGFNMCCPIMYLFIPSSVL